jgi:ATP-dependent RNA helicase RhlE
MKFETLDLAPALIRAVQAKGYELATPIQADAIPPILAGRDVVGCAQTGTGKTAAFALPTLQRILASVEQSRNAASATELQPRALPGGRPEAPATSSQSPGNPRPEAGAAMNGRNQNRSNRNRPSSNPAARRKTRCLVLAPTRELASQIAASFAAYGQFTALRHAVLYGGVSQSPQVKALQHGVDILIATPGRLLDLMNQRHVDLAHVEVLILDEADQMLDMGFLPDLRRIMARVPKQRQTLMFSATMPDAIRKLAQEWLAKPVSLQIAPVGEPAAKVDQSVYFVEKASKGRLLQAWLESTAAGRTLVFARTKHGADKIVKHLMKSKIHAAAIHGNKSQNQRERTLQQFKSNRPPVLIATDIAARGLDIKDITHVVNFDLPEAPETYVHRIGRTGRAGAAGVAVSFCSAEEVKHLRCIERLTRRRIEVGQGHEQLTAAEPAQPAPQSRTRPEQIRPRRSNSRGLAARGSATNNATTSTQSKPKQRQRPSTKKPARTTQAPASATPSAATAHQKPADKPQSAAAQTKRRRRRFKSAL